MLRKFQDDMKWVLMCKQTSFETCTCRSQASLELKLRMFIVMEIYVLVCTNIFLSFYLICITIMSHHFSTMDLHLYIMSKHFKIKISIPFTIKFHKFCTHTTTCSHQVKVFPKVLNNHIYIN
jgi:hypothetical protein